MLHSLLDFSHSLRYPQTGPLWCWFPSGWACARSRPRWVSPTTSPVRLEVSPAATSTPTGVFNQRFEALFPRCRTLGCVVYFFLQVYLHMNVGLPNLQATASSGHLAATLPQVHFIRLPISTPPTYMNECFFFNSLVVGLPYSSIFCQFSCFLFLNLLLSFF